jgi:hypothetical protein
VTKRPRKWNRKKITGPKIPIPKLKKRPFRPPITGEKREQNRALAAAAIASFDGKIKVLPTAKGTPREKIKLLNKSGDSSSRR